MTLNRTTADDRPDRGEESACYVLGGGHLGAAVAGRLRADGLAVDFVDEPNDWTDPPGFQGDPADVRLLEAAGVADASTVVVATRSDSRNLLIAQLVRARFDLPRVVVLANAPDRRDLFVAAGHEPVCATTALSGALVENV